MSEQTLVLDSKRAIAILNSRKTLTPAHVGQQVLLTIQGNGTYQTVDQQKERDAAAGKAAANYFPKWIHNVKANSSEAISRAENKALFTEAMKAESLGNMDEASKLFNEWLNNTQVSFNSIDNGRRKLQNGDAITAFVETAETKLGHMAITLNQVQYKAPEAVAAVKFDISDLMAPEAKTEVPAAVSAEEAVTK